MTKRFEEREIEELKKRKKEKQARKRNGCEAETQGEAGDHQETTKDATVTLVHEECKGGDPWDPPEPDPFCR